MLGGRIVGGNDTTIEQHPWHRCGGMILTPTKTITGNDRDSTRSQLDI